MTGGQRLRIWYELSGVLCKHELLIIIDRAPLSTNSPNGSVPWRPPHVTHNPIIGHLRKVHTFHSIFIISPTLSDYPKIRFCPNNDQWIGCWTSSQASRTPKKGPSMMPCRRHDDVTEMTSRWHDVTWPCKQALHVNCQRVPGPHSGSVDSLQSGSHSLATLDRLTCVRNHIKKRNGAE